MNPKIADRIQRRDQISPEVDSGVVVCCRCDQENSRSRRFCSQCGGNLWITCPKCSTECPVTELFCGTCGADLDQLFRNKAEEYDETLKSAEASWRQHDFAYALDQLRPLTRLQDPRFHKHQERARQLIERINESLEQARGKARHACDVATRHLRQHDYRAALTVIESVPRALRDERLTELLDEANARDDELRRLNDEVTQSVKSGQLAALGAKLERLLVLQPAHETARRLAVQFRDRQIRKANTLLANHQYDEALAALDEIPLSQWNDEAEKIKTQAAELNWLTNDLKQAAVADETLLAIAQRLVKLRPEDREATALLQRVRKAIARPPRDARLGAPDLSPPDSSVFGMPVDWLALPRRIKTTEEAAAVLRRWPGCFWTACGLALQGIDRAAIPINFAPSRQEGVLQKFGWRRKKGPVAAWGLDLGNSSLKAVRLTADRDVSIEQAVHIEHDKELLRVEDPSARREVLVATLRKFLDQHAIQDARLCIGLPSLALLGRFFRLPPVDAKRMEDAVAYEARQQIPLPLDELAWDFHAWPLPHRKDEGENAWRIGLYAVKKFHLQEFEMLCADLDLTVDVLSGKCVALHNLAAFELLGEDDEEPKKNSAVALLDVGTEGSALVIASPNSTWFRHIPVGGETVTSSLVRTFKLTRAQAEQAKRHPARARRLKLLYEAIDPAIAHLMDELERSLHQHGRLFPDVRISHLFGHGGGFQLHGLLRRLRCGR